jgi:uncharacterized protein (TIGR02001 family)
MIETNSARAILAAMRTKEMSGLESGHTILLVDRSRMRRGGLQLILAMVLASAPLLAYPADGPWGASVSATTDYIFRGVSQTYGRGALQLGGNYFNPQGWFAGAWGSNVDPYPGAKSALELDLYTGFSQPLGGDCNASFVYTRYMYLDDPRAVHYGYDELRMSASYLDRLVATISYQPDITLFSNLGYAKRRSSLTYELTGRWPLPLGLAIEVGTGYYDLQRVFGVHYWTGDAGLQYSYRRVSLDLTHFFADPTVARLYGDASANGTWVLSAVARF